MYILKLQTNTAKILKNSNFLKLKTIYNSHSQNIEGKKLNIKILKS